MKSKKIVPNKAKAIDPLIDAMNLYNQEKFRESEDRFKKILMAAPTNGVALYYLALIALNAKQGTEALKYAVSGTESNPNFVPLWLMRASVHNSLQQVNDALDAYNRALEIDSNSVDALINSGVILHDTQRHVESISRFKRALEIDGQNSNALANYGIVLSECRMINEAIDAFERLLTINPTYSFGYGLLTYERMHICNWAGLENDVKRITDGIQLGEKTCKTLGYMALSDVAADHFKCAEIFAKAQFTKKFTPLWQGERYTHKRLKIAYVSPDLREHPVGHLMAGVIENHDRSRYEVICISIGADDNSSIRARLVAASDKFILARSMSAGEIAKLIRELEVDIAIDLAGYTTDSRSEIFMHRAAPVQVNYLGYPGTMALGCYDYIIADKTVLPPEHAQHYSEKAAYLDYCYLPIASGIEVATPLSRDQYGLPAEGFVFCAFSHDYKIHPKVFDVWMRLLHAHPGSVFWLMSRNQATHDNLKREAEARGIDPTRLVFASRVPRVEDHLARYRVADLFLDTWPYNAHTTAADALLSGLPVVTYRGQSFPSRVAASLLESVDMSELATDSFEQYFQTASDLAGNPEHLQKFKDRLTTDKLKSHPFFGASFTRRLETVYDRISTSEINNEAHEVIAATPVATPLVDTVHSPRHGKLSNFEEAVLNFQKANYPQAEFFVRESLKENAADSNGLNLIARIREKYDIPPDFRLSENLKRERNERKFLLIKSWGYGFWSDAHHVATQFLLAELTQREPIVLWGKNCLFNNDPTCNAYSRYFDEKLLSSLNNVPITATIFPSKWNAINLRDEDLNKWEGSQSRISAQQMMPREETLVVSDFYSTIDSLIPWIDSSSNYYGKDENTLYAELFQKYFKATERVKNQEEQFFNARMKGKNWVAVHLRGTDKIHESPHLLETNATYAPYLQRILELNPNIGIFLLTDSEQMLNTFTAEYGDRVLTTAAVRSSTATGVHMSGGDAHNLGDDVLIDALLATRCDYFIGNIESNVSLAIASLKNWAGGYIFMLGKESVRGRNQALHKRQ